MDVVMFGFNDWHQWQATGFRTRCGSIARALADRSSQNRLLVVSTPHSIGTSTLRRLGSSAPAGNVGEPTLRRFLARPMTANVVALEQTRLLPSRALPSAVLRINEQLHDRPLQKAIRRTCQSIGMRDFILWVANPLMAKHIGTLGEAISVFDAIDDWSAHPQKADLQPLIEDGYSLVTQRADVVFTVSKALRERLGHGREGVYWQPNGVDVRRFEGECPAPADLAGMRRPILGYVGVIQERLDVQAVAALSQALPEASIVLVGPVVAPRHVESLLRLANVHMMGERAAGQVPAYIGAFDVCIMPHVDDALTRSMDPLKLYEYLAAGKPVVASGLADSDIPSGLVTISNDSQSFVHHVRSTLDSAGSSASRERRSRGKEFARARSWDARLDEMLAIIERTAGNKGMVVGL